MFLLLLLFATLFLSCAFADQCERRYVGSVPKLFCFPTKFIPSIPPVDQNVSCLRENDQANLQDDPARFIELNSTSLPFSGYFVFEVDSTPISTTDTKGDSIDLARPLMVKVNLKGDSATRQLWEWAMLKRNDTGSQTIDSQSIDLDNVSTICKNGQYERLGNNGPFIVKNLSTRVFSWVFYEAISGRSPASSFTQSEKRSNSSNLDSKDLFVLRINALSAGESGKLDYLALVFDILPTTDKNTTATYQRIDDPPVFRCNPTIERQINAFAPRGTLVPKVCTAELFNMTQSVISYKVFSMNVKSIGSSFVLTKAISASEIRSKPLFFNSSISFIDTAKADFSINSTTGEITLVNEIPPQVRRYDIVVVAYDNRSTCYFDSMQGLSLFAGPCFTFVTVTVFVARVKQCPVSLVRSFLSLDPTKQLFKVQYFPPSLDTDGDFSFERETLTELYPYGIHYIVHSTPSTLSQKISCRIEVRQSSRAQ